VQYFRDVVPVTVDTAASSKRPRQRSVEPEVATFIPHTLYQSYQYAQEAKRLLEQRLPIPAYDHLLKLSHVFNILDARGAVGVTERQACFATLRSLARQVTGAAPPPCNKCVCWCRSPWLCNREGPPMHRKEIS